MGGDKIDQDNIIKIAVIFIVYLFISVVCYYLLSSPIATLFGVFNGIQAGDATGPLAREYTLIMSTMTIVWAIFLAIPITWFVMKIFSREPAWFVRRRY